MNIPKGYKLVPVKPTQKMLDAAYGKVGGEFYKAALAAAPTPPQPIYDEDADRSACRKEWKRRNEHSHFEPVPFPDYWAGWKDCAKSRAKAVEVDHE